MKIDIEKEENGRWIAEVSDLPGVLAYGKTREEAIAKIEALALRVIADYANLFTLRMWGGLLNEVAILLFIVMTVLSIRKSLSGK